MPAPTSTWTTLNTADFEAGDGLREGKLLELLQDVQYVYDAVTASVDENFWLLMEQRLQTGVFPGAGIFGV